MSDMSYKELYLTQSPMIVSPDDKSAPIANIFGVPFDSTHSYKPGCRFGPDVIRDAFNNIEIFHPNLQVDLETANIKDYGNIQHTVVATEMLDMVEKITNELRKENKPIIVLGGEHLLTLGSYMSFPKQTGYVVFDAHYDLRDEYANTKLSHAAYLRRIVEKRGADNIIHVGARSFVKEEFDDFCEKLADKISVNSVRVDIDDRNESIGKRIREAEKEWIQYILVIGEKEANSENLSIRDRQTGKVRDLSFDDFVNEIKEQTKDKPFTGLNFPKYISKRPNLMV